MSIATNNQAAARLVEFRDALAERVEKLFLMPDLPIECKRELLRIISAFAEVRSVVEIRHNSIVLSNARDLSNVIDKCIKNWRDAMWRRQVEERLSALEGAGSGMRPNLSNNVHRILDAAGIKTKNELANWTRWDLLLIKGCGPKTIAAIRTWAESQCAPGETFDFAKPKDADPVEEETRKLDRRIASLRRQLGTLEARREALRQGEIASEQ